MYIYRVLKFPYLTDPLSIIGSEKAPGRWNQEKQGLLYTASNAALALLENVVHFATVPYSELPEMRLFVLDVDETLSRKINPAVLPLGWNGLSSSTLTQTYLNDWIEEPTMTGFACLALGVPSAILDYSNNYLVAPKHPAFSSIRIVSSQELPFDPRLWRL